MRPFSFHVVQETAAQLIGGVTPITGRELNFMSRANRKLRESVQVATPFKCRTLKRMLRNPQHIGPATKGEPATVPTTFTRQLPRDQSNLGNWEIMLLCPNCNFLTQIVRPSRRIPLHTTSISDRKMQGITTSCRQFCRRASKHSNSL